MSASASLYTDPGRASSWPSASSAILDASARHLSTASVERMSSSARTTSASVGSGSSNMAESSPFTDGSWSA